MANSPTYLAGDYAVTYAVGAATPDTLGQIQMGLTLEYAPLEEEIRGSNLGRTLQGIVQQGYDCFIQFTLQQWDHDALISLLWPFASAKTDWGKIPTAGAIFQGNSATTTPINKIVCTANTLSPAAGKPTTITCYNLHLPAGYPTRILFDPSLRVLPLRLQMLPQLVGSYLYWFSAVFAS